MASSQRGRVTFWLLANSFCKLVSYKHGQRNVANKLGLSRTIVTTVGNDFLGHGVESMTNSIQKQIVHALCLGERVRASNLLLDLGHGNYSLRADDFFDILKYCATSPDPLFAMETWRMMEEKEIGLNDICYMLMMRALCRGGYLEEAFNLIKFIGESQGTHVSLPLYNCFLGACAKMRSVNHANQCLVLMENRMVGKNEVTYSELLKLAVWQKNLSGVHEIWKDYVKSYSLSIFPLQKFIWSFARLRDLKSAYETLQHMVALTIRGNISINWTATRGLRSSMLDIPIPANGESGLQKFDLMENEQLDPLKSEALTNNIEQTAVFDKGNREAESIGTDGLAEHISKPAMEVLMQSFSFVINACAQSQNFGLAEQLMLQMQNLGLQPSSHAYDSFVRAVVSKSGFGKGMELLKIMQQKNLKPLDSTLAALSVSCCKALQLDLAESLLDQTSNCPYPYPYNAFFDACDKMDQPERAVRMLAKMKQSKVRPNIRTYELLFALFGTVNAPYESGHKLSQLECAKRINSIEMDMEKNEVHHSHLSMKHLLKALGDEMMIRELMQYLRKAEVLFLHGNTHVGQKNAYLGTPVYNTVLYSLVKAKQINLATKIFKHMKSNGFWSNGATYNIMIKCSFIARNYKSASSLLSMMLRDGFYPTTVTYTYLLKILSRNGKVEEALNLLDQGISEGIQPNVMLYNSILQKAHAKRRIDIIERIVERMHREKVQPDPTTCSLVFSAYVKCRFYSTAVEALQVLSMRMICQEDSALQEKKAEFEDNYIFSEDLEAESRIFWFFKHYEEHTAVALFNLRKCAILGFPISWSPNQTLWARTLSSNYDARQKNTS